MHKRKWRAFTLAAAVLLVATGGLAAQSGGEPEEQPPPEAQEQPLAAAAQDQGPPESRTESRPAPAARRSVPQVTGTVTVWKNDRIELKTPEGTTQLVAVNPSTERLVEIAPGAEVTVEYRRKVSGFVIAERVLPAKQEGAAPAAAAPAQEAASMTGKVVSWNDAALVLATESGEVTLFLSPETEYLVESLDPGLQVLVEYQTAGDAKLATRVRVAQAKGKGAKEREKP